MKLIDYHLHTNHSFDSKQTMFDVCKKSVENGINEICFTDHLSLSPLSKSYKFLDKNKYQQDIQELKKVFSEKLVIKTGLEICEPHLLEEGVSNEIRDMDLDFILGSIHNINNVGLREFGQITNADELYTIYFSHVLKLVNSKNLDVVAHLDLIKRYAFEKCGECNISLNHELLTKVFKKLIESGKGIEVNTSSLKTLCKSTMPNLDILNLYKSYGGEIITIGSDAHKLDDVSKDILGTYNLLRDIGFKYVFTYNKRNPIIIYS